MTDYYQLSDAEWEWVACFLEDRTAPSADALRGYLNDRITERLVTARAEERERTQGIIEELENHIDHLPGHIHAQVEALTVSWGYGLAGAVALVRRDDVIALLDGSGE